LDARFPYVAIQFAAGGALLGLAYIGWKRRRAPSAATFVCLCLSLALWAAGSALENAQIDLSAAVFWAKFKYFGLVLTPPAWLVFALQYTGRIVRLTRRDIALLSIFPLATLLLVWTTELHRLYWSSYRIAFEQDPPMFDTTRGSLYVVVAAVGYAQILIGMGHMLRLAWSTRRIYRAQSLLITASVLLPLLGNAAFLANLIPVQGIDATPILFSIACIVIGYGLLRLRLLDLVPVARNMAIESINDGILVLDDQLRVVDLNRAMEEIIGSDAQNHIGKHVEELYAQHPELHGDSEEFSLNVKGQLHYYEWRVTAIRDRQEHLHGHLYTFRDVTDRKQAENALSMRVQQLAALVRVDETLTKRLDVEYVLDIALDAAMELCDADCGGIAVVEDGDVRLVHTRGSYTDLLTDSYPPRDSGIVARVLRECQPVLITDTSSDPDYIPVVPETRAQMTLPLMSRDLLIGVLNLETATPEKFTPEVFQLIKLMTVQIAIALDNARLYQLAQTQLSELRTLYDKVHYLERLKTDMIRIAAHDLRNPIHLVNTYAALLQDDLRPILSDQHRQFLEAIDRAAGQMLRITNNILSPERIEQNAESMQLIDLRNLVEENYFAHKDQARQKRLTYEVALPEQSMSVNGDPSQLSEALANLIVNAIKYTPEGGHILVSLLQNKSRAVVNVEDTGYGIPAEQQEKLFQPFFRADMNEIKHIDGTGLGLHLVKNIVERHFGKVHFKSIQGQGSTFGFELLLVQND
jgi:PAS domain S-box-containing protein